MSVTVSIDEFSPSQIDALSTLFSSYFESNDKLLNKDYSVKKVYLMKTVSKDIDAEAIRVLKDSGFKFGPIIKRGQLHEYIVYVLPLKFKPSILWARRW